MCVFISIAQYIKRNIMVVFERDDYGDRREIFDSIFLVQEVEFECLNMIWYELE